MRRRIVDEEEKESLRCRRTVEGELGNHIEGEARAESRNGQKKNA